MGFVSIVGFIYFFFNKQQFRFLLTDGFVLFFVGSIFLSAFVFNDAFTITTKLVILVLLLVLYLYLRLVLNKNRQIINLLCFCIILTGLVEAIWGMMQLYGLLPSQHGLFKLTGSLFNPGPYAGYLAVVFPLSLYTCLPCPSSRGVFVMIKQIVAVVTCVAILLVLPADMSRASWLAAIAGSMVAMADRWRGLLDIKGLLRRLALQNDAGRGVPRIDPSSKPTPRKV